MFMRDRWFSRFHPCLAIYQGCGNRGIVLQAFTPSNDLEFLTRLNPDNFFSLSPLSLRRGVGIRRIHGVRLC